MSADVDGLAGAARRLLGASRVLDRRRWPAVRVRIRIMGADLVELATGADAVNPPDVAERGPDAGSADLAPAGRPFGFAPHDEPLTWDE